MALTRRDHDRHADRVFDVVRSGLHELDNDVVTRSWSRCLNEYQLHPDKPRQPSIITSLALQSRCEQRADIIDCARYEMTTLYQQLADMESAVVLTDTDGLIIHMVSSPDFAAEVAPLGLVAGGMWSEVEAGTNGMGTCLASARPVSIRREDHFYSQFTQLTCSAVPVFDPAGEIAAVLDVTSRSGMMQQHLLVLLGMTARMIENRLIDQRFRTAHPLHFHSRPEFVYTLHEGKLAVDHDGRVLAANRSALFQLGLNSMEDIRAHRIEDLFQTSLEDMLQRSASSSFHPVVTYRANAALRFFAVARRPASDAASGSSFSTPTAASMAGLVGAGASSAGSLAGSSVGTGARRPMRAPGSRGASTVTSTFKDAKMIAHLETARRVIARQTPLLLCGETGSGKEVFARAVHDNSPHAGGAFIAVNCASLPETLIESELFGYRAGAFTGAQRTGRRGKILQADGGTLFLDEIADMPLELQARLLRVLDERQVTPLGTEETHAVDFQLISASHNHLLTLVKEGRFREDLYYRLAGIELQLPPLRERSDKRELIRGMLSIEAGGDDELSAEGEKALMEYSWPGNIRQLRHVLRSAAALADGKPITREHLPSLVASASPAPLDAAQPASPRPGEPAVRLNPIQANERQVLVQMLEQHRWNVSNVAKALDVSRNTLYRKLHKLHIEISILSEADAPLPKRSRFAWCITGSGHFLEESMALAARLPNVDLFLSAAAAEVLEIYKIPIEALKPRFRVFRDKTASGVPVGMLYDDVYHSVVIAPATSNTVAKCAYGISDSLPTNMFAQAGKLGIPGIVFACDTEPVVVTKSPHDWVTLRPRGIEFENVERLKAIDFARVVGSAAELEKALDDRLQALSLAWSA